MPEHEFVLEDRSVADSSSFLWDSIGGINREGLTEDDYVSFDDEFITYINDSLNWIPTRNPSTKEVGHGLNNYGVTIIDDCNLSSFKGIIQAWTDMFGFASERIVLTGSYYTTGESEQCGKYESLEYNKSDLLKKLIKLIELTDRATDEDKCILHLGI